MPDVGRLFQAFVAPAIFVSAAALLILSLNVRLMGMVTRLRQFQREHHMAVTAERTQEAEALVEQISSVEGRTEMIRKAMLLMLLSLAGTILSCLLMGLGLYWEYAHLLVVTVFPASILCMLVGTLFYLAEIMVALSSVREEAKYYHVMDLTQSHDADSERSDRRGDWSRPG